MPAPDDLYWNPMDLNPNHEDPYAAVLQTKPYIDSWDLENYAYLKQHLGSVELNSDPSSLDSPGQSLSPDLSSTYYRRTDNYDRQHFSTNKYGYQIRSNHHYDIDELAEDDDKLYESFGENYGLNYHQGFHNYGMNRFNIAEDKPSQYGYAPLQNGGRKMSRPDIYLSMDRASTRLNQNRNRNRYSESTFDRHGNNDISNGNGVYSKTDIRGGPKRRFSEQPRTDFGRMQAENQKLQLPLQTQMNGVVRRRVSTSGRLPLPVVTPVAEEVQPIEEEYGSDLEDSFEPEDSMLPIYNTGNRTTMADIHRMDKNSRNSFSYEYDPYRPVPRQSVAPHPLYGRLESVYGFALGVGGISPLYDDIRTLSIPPAVPKPDHFTLGDYGHLQIDYSCNWTHLNRYIRA